MTAKGPSLMARDPTKTALVQDVRKIDGSSSRHGVGGDGLVAGFARCGE